MMTRRYGLRDDQWERIKDWLLGREGHVGQTAKDNRLFVEAVLYRYRALRTGAPVQIEVESLDQLKKALDVGAESACSTTSARR
jgi:nicotinate-nucleotide pyrophosphorylase